MNIGFISMFMDNLILMKYDYGIPKLCFVWKEKINNKKHGENK